MFEQHLLAIKKLATETKKKNLNEEELEKELKIIATRSGISYETIKRMYEEHFINNNC